MKEVSTPLISRKQVTRLARDTAILTVLVAGMFIAGTLIRLPPEEAGPVAEDFKARMPSEITPLTITLNNLRVMLFTSIWHPIGTVVAVSSGFTAGFAYSVIATTKGVVGTDVAIVALTKPFFWLEISAYSLAAAQSLHLGRILRPKGIWFYIKANLKQMSYIFTPWNWKKLSLFGPKDPTMTWKVRLLLGLFHIDIRTIDKAELKRQLVISGIILVVGTCLLTLGSIAEMQAIEEIAQTVEELK